VKLRLKPPGNGTGGSGEPSLLGSALAVLVGISTLTSQTSGVFTLTPVANGMQLKTPNGRVVFDYLTKKPAEVELTSPSTACFHPVNTPTGERVTALAPDDHRHHRGVYLAWHDSEFRQPISTDKRTPTSPLFGWNITKADFWGWGVYAPRDGRVIQTTDVKLAGADAQRARIEIHNDWIVGKRKMLDETATATVAERDGVYVLDLTFRLAPVVDYLLNKQSFSGFNFQARKDGDSYFTNPAGQVTVPDPHYSVPELNWPPSPWYGYVIKLTNGKTVGAAVLDHPLNPPSTWHNSRTLWMLNPNVAALAPLTIRADAPLTLRYRVVVHDGPTPTAVVQNLSDEWRTMK
jgi:hypothetical protein